MDLLLWLGWRGLKKSMQGTLVRWSWLIENQTAYTKPKKNKYIGRVTERGCESRVLLVF